MDIIVNGTPFTLPGHMNIMELILLKKMETGGIAVAINEVVIPRAEWKTTEISEGDNIIIITATAGG